MGERLPKSFGENSSLSKRKGHCKKILKDAHLRGKKWGGGRQPSPAVQGGVGAEPYSIAEIGGFYHFISSGRAGYVGRRSDVVAAEHKKADADADTDGGGDAGAEHKVHKSLFCYHNFSPPSPFDTNYVSNVYPVFKMPSSPWEV